MPSSSSFRSLDHAIDVAKNIFLNKVDVGCWLEDLFYRDCFNNYMATTTKSIKQEANEKYEDISYGVKTTTLNSAEVNSIGTDHVTEFDTNNDPQENFRGLDGNQTKVEEHVRPKRGFDVNLDGVGKYLIR
ncbi:hypothetical protein PIB30_047786 [Stylosanthes scabra]|uniref:Uncharacterized protein n=1 Tax=Stylosanthes scabra TaxID=79078 RepID=A0ABU6UHF9_9FABA|nr:hypothetical protein [Stylosanthes scabra]